MRLPQPPVTPKGNGAAPSGPSRRLDANPLFVGGAPYDELALTPANLAFAQTQFGLDQDFVDLVKTAPPSTRFSVVYHSDAQGLHVDAYRTIASAGKAAAFAAYKVKDASFDPGKAYKNERVTSMGGDRWFGTILSGKRIAVPENADADFRQFLATNNYALKETVPLSSFEHPRAVTDYFGLDPNLKLEMHQIRDKSFMEKAKLFFQLCAESPEYRALKIADVLDEIGSAMCLGVITPRLFEQGTRYGVAAAMSSIANIGSPFVGILGESVLGSVVDNAVNSDRPMEGLKRIVLWTGALRAARVGATFAMHPSILSMLGSSPGAAFIGLYATTAALGSVAGVVAGKADFAIKDQIINKGVRANTDYSRNFYQILGVEASISRAIYLGAYAGTVAAAAAFPGASVAIAGTGAALWAASNFVFPLYHEKPEVRIGIEGTSYVHQGDRYIFDSGWEVSFRGPQGRIVQDGPNQFSIAFNEGELCVKSGEPDPVNLSHTRRLKDYLPGFLKPKMIGEKERWELDDGEEKVTVARYGNSGYKVHQLSDREFIVSQSDRPTPF
ncbi:MAG: hypothetical protein FJX76_15320 [Armatimonadetes bacterium]|nr:hypothetical protein [Armatimonadota bacterium]